MKYLLWIVLALAALAVAYFVFLRPKGNGNGSGGSEAVNPASPNQSSLIDAAYAAANKNTPPVTHTPTVDSLIAQAMGR